jgi:hypothetical protein
MFIPLFTGVMNKESGGRNGPGSGSGGGNQGNFGAINQSGSYFPTQKYKTSLFPEDCFFLLMKCARRALNSGSLDSLSGIINITQSFLQDKVLLYTASQLLPYLQIVPIKGKYTKSLTQDIYTLFSTLDQSMMHQLNVELSESNPVKGDNYGNNDIDTNSIDQIDEYGQNNANNPHLFGLGNFSFQSVSSFLSNKNKNNANFSSKFQTDLLKKNPTISLLGALQHDFTHHFDDKSQMVKSLFELLLACDCSTGLAIDHSFEQVLTTRYQEKIKKMNQNKDNLTNSSQTLSDLSQHPAGISPGSYYTYGNISALGDTFPLQLKSNIHILCVGILIIF